MKKKATNEDIANFIKQCAEEINSQLDYELRVADSAIWRAEKELIDTFTDKQKNLYCEFLNARQHYYDILTQKYKTVK